MREHIIWLVVTLLFSQPANAQLFYKAPGNTAWQVVNEKQPLLAANGKNLGDIIKKAYENRVKNSPVYIADSVYVSIVTHHDGRFAAILFSRAASESNLNALVKSLRSAQFAENGTHSFALIFPKKSIAAYPVWEVEEPPRLPDCLRAAKDGNKLFYTSCFAYMVQRTVEKVPVPPNAKKSRLAGYFNATVTVSPRGEAEMVTFDSLSTNAALNDYFAESLFTLKFPKGGKVSGQEVGYTFTYQNEYFGNTTLNKSQIDSTVQLNANYLAVNMKTISFSPYSKEAIDSAVQQGNTLLNYHVGHRKFALRSDTGAVIMGNFLLASLASVEWIFNVQAAVLTPSFYGSKGNNTYPAAVAACAPYSDAEYVATCTANSLLEKFYVLFGTMPPSDLPMYRKVSKQVVLVDAEGHLQRIQVTAGNFHLRFDVEVMEALASWPDLVPGHRNGKQTPTLYTVIAILY